MEVAAWLKSLGLEQYAQAFADNDVDFGVLAQLTDADLKELGVGSLGHRKRLLTAIAARGTTSATIPKPTTGAPSGERRQVTILFADLCTQLLAPAEQLAGVNPSCTGDLGGDCARLHRRCNNPFLLCPRPSPATLHRGDHFNLRLGHRTSPRSSPIT